MEIGDRNTIREFCTINRGTAQRRQGHARRQRQLDHGLRALRARLPDRQQHHLRQPCQLAGHVWVGDWAIFGATTLVHQFVHIGAHAFTGMGTYLPQDLPPFVMAAGNMAQPFGINKEGLKRRGFSPEAIAGLKRAYKTLYRKGLGLEEAINELRRQAAECAEVQQILDFLDRSKRGIIR